MSFFDLIRTSATNLYQRRARTLLTILGVIIGTMSIVLMIALGAGSEEVFMEQISQSSDLTKIEVYSGGSSGATKLNDDAVKSLEQIDGVRAVMPIANASVCLRNSRYAAEVGVTAVPLATIEEMADKLEWGAVVKSSDIQLYIGKSMASWSFFKYQPGVTELWEMQQAPDVDLEGETFDMGIGSYTYYYSDDPGLPVDITVPETTPGQVAGMFTETGSELDYQAYMDIDLLKKFISENSTFCESVGISAAINSISVYTNDMNEVEGVLASIKEAGYQAYSPMEYIKQMQEESSRQQAQWGAVGAIALLVSAIGIINTMMTSIMERKREIGVLKVLGCSLGNISAMFLIEAAIIGMLGGVIGVGLSYGISALVNGAAASGANIQIFSSMFGDSVRFVIKPYIAIAAVLGAAAIGMIAGIYPSVRAMRMPPLAALRDE